MVNYGGRVKVDSVIHKKGNKKAGSMEHQLDVWYCRDWRNGQCSLSFARRGNINDEAVDKK
jgi:hypothetical protein